MVYFKLITLKYTIEQPDPILLSPWLSKMSAGSVETTYVLALSVLLLPTLLVELLTVIQTTAVKIST